MHTQEIHRLLESINSCSKPGIPGTNILSLTPEDKAARELLKGEMQRRKLDIYVDVIGNMIGVRKGKRDLPAVAIGSHLDSVAQGGKYDGPTGIIAGLAVVDYLNENEIETEHPVAVINFTNEEGARFTPDMMGSYVFNGMADLESIYASHAVDDKEVTVKSALEEIGYLGSLAVGSFPLKAFIELHIEQGKVLESEEIELGIVEAVQGIYWTEYQFTGESNHAGTTPMSLRKDAGNLAFRLAAYTRELADDVGSPQVITCGKIDLQPNLPNIVAGSASLVLDNRHPSLKVLQETQDQLDFYAQTLASEEGLSLSITPKVRVNPLTFSASIVAALEEAVQELGYTYKKMISGAGHDAQLVGMTYPSAMLFVPSRRGISHNPEEFTELQHIAQAIEVMTQAVLSLAG